MDLTQYKFKDATPIEMTFISKYKNMNNLALEPIFNSMLGKRNMIPNAKKYIETGLELAKIRMGLIRADIKKYDKNAGIESYNSLSEFEKAMFEKATKDRLANTYLSRIIELVIADRLIKHFSRGYLSTIKVYSDSVLDTVFGVDLVLMIGDIPFYIHVTKTRDISSELMETQEAKKYPVRAKTKPFNIKGWVSHKRDYTGHLWCFYDDLYNIHTDKVIEQVDRMLKEGYSDAYEQVITDYEYDYELGDYVDIYSDWTQLELFLYHVNRTKPLRNYEPIELELPGNLGQYDASELVA